MSEEFFPDGTRRQGPPDATLYCAFGKYWIAGKAPDNETLGKWFAGYGEFLCTHFAKRKAQDTAKWAAMAKPFQLETEEWWLI